MGMLTRVNKNGSFEDKVKLCTNFDYVFYYYILLLMRYRVVRIVRMNITVCNVASATHHALARKLMNVSEEYTLIMRMIFFSNVSRTQSCKELCVLETSVFANKARARRKKNGCSGKRTSNFVYPHSFKSSSI